eukprot:262543-Chlamydomonas_euryale.AAC.4
MDQAVQHYKAELSNIRSGRANPGLLEPVQRTVRSTIRRTLQRSIPFTRGLEGEEGKQRGRGANRHTPSCVDACNALCAYAPPVSD